MHIDQGQGPSEGGEPIHSAPSSKLPFEEFERIRTELKEKLVEHSTKRWIEFLDRPENIRELEEVLRSSFDPLLTDLKRFEAVEMPDRDLPEALKQAKQIAPKIVKFAPLVIEMIAHSPSIRKMLAEHLAKQEFSDPFALSANFAGQRVKLKGLGVPESVIEQFSKVEEKLEAVIKRRSELLDYRVQISRELGINVAASETARESFLRMTYGTKAAYLSQLDTDARETTYAIRDTIITFARHSKSEGGAPAAAAMGLFQALGLGIGSEGPIRRFLRKFDEEDAERIFRNDAT